MRSIALVSLFLLAGIHAVAQPFAVGHTTMNFTDPTRSNRSIPTEVYYPAQTAGNNVPISPGQYPVVSFGHGFVMTVSAYDVIWDSLVPHGYIVALPTTEGSFSPSHADFGQDLAFVIGAMRTESTNSNSIFFNSVSITSAVMGHSMGGGSSFLAMQFDSTITTMVTLAAAVTNPSSVSAAASIQVPTLVLSGTNDCVAPPAQHQQIMYDSLGSVCKTHVSITGGGHCYFASSNFNCSFGEGTCSPNPTITRAQQQVIAFSYIIPWLDFHLKNDCIAGQNFQSLATTSNGVSVQQTCATLCTSIADGTEDSIELYPNPATESCTISGYAANFKTYEVVTLTGQIVSTGNLLGNNTVVSLVGIAPGMYFITLRGEESSSTTPLQVRP